MNQSSWALVETTATTTCRAYGQLLHSLGQDTPSPFGQFGSVQNAIIYDGVRILVMAVTLLAISVFSMFDFLSYASKGVRWFFFWMRLIEAILLFLVAGTLDVILTMTLFGITSQARNNPTCLVWMTMGLALILNSFWISVHFSSHYKYSDKRAPAREEWAPSLINFNWVLFSALLLSLNEGVWTQVLLRQFAALSFLLSTIFGTASKRYCSFDADKSFSARIATVAFYTFQAIGALLLCLTYSTHEAPPVHLLLTNAPSSPLFIVIIVVWCLFGCQFLGLSIAMVRSF